jgi:hypothetical protein
MERKDTELEDTIYVVRRSEMGWKLCLFIGVDSDWNYDGSREEEIVQGVKTIRGEN